MTDYTKLTSEVLRLLCQQSSLSITGNRQALISRIKAQQQSKPTGSRLTSARAKRQKTTSTPVCTTEVTPETEPREEPNDQAAIPPPNANTTGEDPLNEAQPPITVDQITSIVSAIVANWPPSPAHQDEQAPQLRSQPLTLAIQTRFTSYYLSLVTSQHMWTKKLGKPS